MSQRRALPGLMFLCLASLGTAAFAQPANPQRCATRLSATLLGKTATAAALASTNPQQDVDTMLASPDFIERFARFVNATFNVNPGQSPAEDASYYLAKYVLQNNKPWSDMFLGAYRVDPGASATADAVVTADANGLGYFRSPTWMKRYAGNELVGYRIVSAYRMMNNVIGLKLTAAKDTMGIDAAGRMQPACAGCHYDPTFGLDLAAKLLSKRVGTGNNITFSPPTEGPQKLLDGQTLGNDKDFVTALVNSTDYRFRSCRLAFLFLYGRLEFTTESAVFNSCLSAFSSAGTMQSALAAVAKDPSFCP